jgi:hypothetical protein
MAAVIRWISCRLEHAAVAHMDLAAYVRCGLGIVGDHEDCPTEAAVEVGEQAEHDG